MNKGDFSDKMQALLSHAKPKRAALAVDTPSKPSITISGTSVHIGDVHNYPAKIVNKIVINHNTGSEHIQDAQKAKLTALVNDIVELSTRLKKTPTNHAAVWGALKRALEVSSYHLIPLASFDKAEKHLLQKKARLNGTKSAPNKSSNWRNSRVKAIHARCSNFEDGKAKKEAYMVKNFATKSLINLPDDDLETVYRYVMSWKTP
jgi:hypothetical protein